MIGVGAEQHQAVRGVDVVRRRVTRSLGAKHHLTVSFTEVRYGLTIVYGNTPDSASIRAATGSSCRRRASRTTRPMRIALVVV